MTLSCGVLLAAVAAKGVVGGTVTLGAENLGWTLDETLERTILAMRSCEEKVAKEMGE